MTKVFVDGLKATESEPERTVTTGFKKPYRGELLPYINGVLEAKTGKPVIRVKAGGVIPLTTEMLCGLHGSRGYEARVVDASGAEVIGWTALNTTQIDKVADALRIGKE